MSLTVIATGRSLFHSHSVTLNFEDGISENAAGSAALEHLTQLGFKNTAITVIGKGHVYRWPVPSTDEITGGAHG